MYTIVFGAIYYVGGAWCVGGINGSTCTPILIGFCKLCPHNFEHYGYVLAFENNASIIGIIIFKDLLAQLYICSQNLNKEVIFDINK